MPNLVTRHRTLAAISVLSIVGIGALWLGYSVDSADGVGIAGSIASVAGLIVSAYVALTVRRIRVRYIRQVVFKECLGKLKAHRRNLSSAINNNDGDRVRQQLARVNAVLARIALHVPETLQVEWSDQRFNAVLNSDDLIVAVRANEILYMIDERMETLSLMLTEMEWGDDND